MLKPTWLIFLCILVYVTMTSATQVKRRECEDEYDEPKKSATKATHKPAPIITATTLHDYQTILVTVTDKIIATHVPTTEPKYKNSPSSKDQCNSCETSCEHLCTDNICHTCKDGPCHVVCVYKTRKLNQVTQRYDN